jgi:hypothetical protein
MPTVTASPGRAHASPARARRHPARILVAVAVLVAAVAVPAALVGMRADQAPVVRRPELQRVLVELTSGSGRIAPGATAYVAGPHGTWTGAGRGGRPGHRRPASRPSPGHAVLLGLTMIGNPAHRRRGVVRVENRLGVDLDEQSSPATVFGLVRRGVTPPAAR